MTARQLEVLQALHHLIDEVGWPPTVRELGARIDANASTTHWLLAALERDGLIARGRDGSPRALRITTQGHWALRNARAA